MPQLLHSSMLFEIVIQRFFGKAANNIADLENHDRSRNNWLKKVAKKILLEVDAIDTYEDHKKQLFWLADEFKTELEGKNPDFRVLVYLLLALIASLLGFNSPRGIKLTTPSYIRTSEQYYTSLIIKGGDALQDYKDKQNVVVIRRKIVADLKANGIDDFHIALALNTSENQIKKLRNEVD